MLLGIKNLKRSCNFKLNSRNEIVAEGAAKLGEGFAKLINLTSLILNFKYKF
jgi:hypothetical protein